MGCFVELCRRGLKINSDKSKFIVLNGEGVLVCDVLGNGMRLEHVSEFKYLGMYFE